MEPDKCTMYYALQLHDVSRAMSATDSLLAIYRINNVGPMRLGTWYDWYLAPDVRQLESHKRAKC